MFLELEPERQAIVEIRDISPGGLPVACPAGIDLHVIVEEIVGIERDGCYVSYFFRHAEVHGEIRGVVVLLELVDKGLTREDAYKIVQKNALDAFENDGDFKANLMQDEDVTKHLSVEEIDKIFDKQAFLKNINEIYKRIL